MSDENKEIKEFVEKMDKIIEELDNHPKLKNYYLMVTDTLKNINTSIRTDFKI